MAEFDLEAHGVDISDTAIAKAQSLSSQMNVGNPRPTFAVVDGVSIPFRDRYFDVSICVGVADSMRFDLARRLVRELDRVTKSLGNRCTACSMERGLRRAVEGYWAFMTLISDLDGARPSEKVIETKHERGTIQTYYSEDKIDELLKATAFDILSSVHVLRSNASSGERDGRWHLAVSKM